MEKKYVDGDFVKSAVIERVYKTYKDDFDSFSMYLYKEQANQFADKPLINVKLRRVNQDSGYFGSDLIRLYMFEITYLHPKKEEDSGEDTISFNDIADNITHKLLLALNRIDLPYYGKDLTGETVEYNSIVKAEELYTAKDVNVLSIFASYKVRIDRDYTDDSVFESHKLGIINKEVNNGR